ncbi:MAG: hypothetical protein IKO61_12145 [Lachnospiraceae bacterium]|nr:hypothetical protein [Lachnospiraceae bacterium]
MKKIINTFKYSSMKAKIVLGLALVAALAALGLVAGAIFTKQLAFFFGAVICAFAAIALFDTFNIHAAGDGGVVVPLGEGAIEPNLTLPEGMAPVGENVPENAAAGVTAEQALAGMFAGEGASSADSGRELDDIDMLLRKMTEDVEVDESEKEQILEESGKKKGFFARLFKKIFKGKLREKKPAREDVELEAAGAETGNEADSTTTVKKKKKKVKKKTVVEVVEPGKVIKTETKHISAPDVKVAAPDEPNVFVVRQASEQDLAQYDRKSIKKLLHKYKVKRDHRPVMIDRCDEFFIKQTPAYVWVDGKEFHVLLIEKEPRHLSLPIHGLREMRYLKKQVVNKDIDYGAFKGKSMLAELFRPYLPDLTQSTVVDDPTATKNLYGFGPGMYVTNRSAANIFDLLAMEFRVDDKVTLSAKVNYYFKEAYKANILLRDNVIDANGYADRIAKTLDDMAHSRISNGEFEDTLKQMIKNKLITLEFANHYRNVREKLQTS